jgi:ubiquinone/menaquinone biosynthesis C-methylase UbiE
MGCRFGRDGAVLGVRFGRPPGDEPDAQLAVVVGRQHDGAVGERVGGHSLAGMAPRTDTLYAREYFLAVEGLAILRNVVTHPSAIRDRVDEVRGIVAGFDEFPNSLAIPVVEHEIEEGYTAWAPRYDRGGNPAILGEEPVVHELLARLPTGVALDAACGTGRHAAKLAELGHRVIGVDTTDAMLDVARAKVPGGDFRRGRLEDLPLDDASVDLITCGLALTHAVDLGPVMREFARVLRPGGHAVLSDIHPVAAGAGTVAAFPDGDLTKGIPYVHNIPHPVSAYVTAFVDAGLSIAACVEPPFTE